MTSRYAPVASIGFLMLVMVVVCSNLNWSKDFWKDIIEADAKGNYAYLPAVFIYHDLNFGFFDKIEKEKYYNQNLYYDYRACIEGKTINKYFAGTALAQLPFFLIAHGYTLATNGDADGFSRPYPVMISVAALFYLLLGLVFLYKSLVLYQIENKFIAFVLPVVVFGTNVFYYVVGEPGMSHIYSFAFCSMFIFYGKRYFQKPNDKHLLLLAALSGMIAFIRPVNVIVLLALPFLSGGFGQLKTGFGYFFRRWQRMVYALTLFLFFPLIQLTIYRLSTGSFFVYSYGPESFNFSHPHFIDILFSYKKGLFLYTPVLFLSLTGGYFLWKENRFGFYTLFSFLIILTVVLSSWWNWWYGGSFSSRVYLEFIPFFAILLGITINSIRNKVLRKGFLGMVFLLVVVCQIQTYQYRYYQIHWENMTREKYWNVFLRVDKLM